MKFKVSSAKLSVLLALFLVVFHNNSFWRALLKVFDVTWSEHIAFLVAVFVALVVFLNLMFTLLSGRYLLKPVAILFVIAASFASHFMDSYGVLMERNMLLNALQTDIGETYELVNIQMVLKVTLLGLLPAGLIYYADIDRSSGVKRFVRLKVVFMSLLIMASIAGVFFQEFASMVRNERHLRHLINPINFSYALITLAKRNLTAGPVVIQAIGEDAVLGNFQQPGEKNKLFILVVGETARAQNFSLNGYERPTNPVLEKENLINFSAVTSCGTATATSLPCMFSKFNRSDYSHAKGRAYENLLDVLQTAGVGVLWRENNSGCKGVCDRVDTDELVEADVVEFCATGECFDEVLLANLQDYVSTLKKDTVIVLHQKGSHGPSYYLRYPEAFAVFKPVCTTNQLQNCQQSEITNGYDNTILYTDYFLGQVIGFLKQNSVQFSTAMLYLSDHGESLGENNLYLHGLPYMMAPAEQTHIPMALWLPDVAYGQRWSRSCLDKASQRPLSHDNLFHSVLGFMGVQTKVYSTELDFFSNCQLKQ
ncbi:MAG: phosphoethanolamine--lipid A transferase [Methylococcales bacterium]|nr:phosphoethanolamine--lipid A transferase [Methylococcales bacterium]